MDKKSIIGFVLIGLILFGYSWYQGEQSRKASEAYWAEQRALFVADSIDRAEHPEKYFIPVTFTSNNPGKREPDKYYLYPHQVPEDFRPWLDDQWYDLPDVITPKDVETVLGYEHESVRRWINRGWLRIAKAHNAELVPREWLIDFTCDYAFRIVRKSKPHRKLLDKYFG